ncbi:MAG: hypothetical protein WBF87_08095 [Mesorhizobium sp.]
MTSMTTACFDNEWTETDASDERDAKARLHSDAALDRLLSRSDDRLLKDAGLTREGILGEDGAWWARRRRFLDGWDL